MKALVLSSHGIIEIKSVDNPELTSEKVLIKIKAASLNHRDEWCRQGKYPNIKYRTTLGSDGAGVVAAVGDPKNKPLIGKEVIINPNIDWGDNPAVQSNKFKILGMPDNGTFAEYIAVNVDRISPKPAHLDFAMAAALPLGGLTAFRAVFSHGQITKERKVLITGVGGGVSQFAFLFSVAVGAHVYVTSSKPGQIAKAISLGAKDGFDYKKEDWEKSAVEKAGKFDVIIDSAGGDQLNTLIKLTKPGGKIIFYGATTGQPSLLNMHALFWNQITLQGSTMGNDQEFEAMVQFVSDHKIIPIIDSSRPFEEIFAAFEIMKAGQQSGKLVVTF